MKHSRKSRSSRTSLEPSSGKVCHLLGAWLSRPGQPVNAAMAITRRAGSSRCLSRTSVTLEAGHDATSPQLYLCIHSKLRMPCGRSTGTAICCPSAIASADSVR